MSMRIVAAGLLAAGLLAVSLAAPARADEQAEMVTRAYAVADLVVPVSDVLDLTLPGAAAPQAAPACKSSPACCANNAGPKPAETCEQRLMKLIAQTIAPASWSACGGRGTMEYYPLGMALVVRQTPAVHEQLADLLARLRRLQDVEVALELRFLSIPDVLVERIGIDFNLPVKTKEGHGEETCESCPIAPPFDPLRVTFLNAKQVSQLLESVDGDRRASVLQAPKMTVFNGQAVTVNRTDERFYVTGVQVVQNGGQVVYVPENESLATGHSLSVRPAVSADGRSVRLQVQLDQKTLATPKVPLFPVTTFITPVFEGGAVGQPVPFTQFLQQPQFQKLAVDRTVVVPDGGSVLLGGLKA